MILDFLMKALRRVARSTESRKRSSSIGAKDESLEEEDESFDPMNPFPDPVITDFSDVIDLHSIPPRQVRAVIEDYLEEAHRRGFECVRIIHGKGIGVQREIIRSTLARTPFVIDFKDAPPEAGGWGATIVTLKNSRQ